MPNPRRRFSKSRSRKRRGAAFKAKTPTTVECPQCREMKPPHCVCPNCGYYAGRAVVEPEEE